VTLTTTRKNSLVASASSLVNGALSAVVLLLSARFGQIEEIAAYTVMTAVLAFVSIGVAGGTTLLYVSGTEEQRLAVRSQRLIVVFPCLVAGALAAGLFYGHRGYAVPALAASAVVVVGNNLAELHYGDLTRSMRVSGSAVAVCLSKLSALGLLLIGLPLTFALAAASGIQLAVLQWLLRDSSWLGPRSLSGISVRRAWAGSRANGWLMGYSLAELFNGRAATVVLSLVASPKLMGSFGAVVSVGQAIGTVFYSTLQVPMAARVRNRHGLSTGSAAHREIEIATVLGSVVVGVLVVLSAPWLTQDVLNLPVADAADWLCVFGLALPFTTANRALTLTAIGEGNYRLAARISLTIAGILAAGLALGVPLWAAMGAAVATLCAEALTTVVVGVRQLRAVRRSRTVEM
jgi:O-antigen/teichoic acid export membrane protein